MSKKRKKKREPDLDDKEMEELEDHDDHEVRQDIPDRFVTPDPYSWRGPKE